MDIIAIKYEDETWISLYNSNPEADNFLSECYYEDIHGDEEYNDGTKILCEYNIQSERDYYGEFDYWVDIGRYETWKPGKLNIKYLLLALKLSFVLFKKVTV